MILPINSPDAQLDNAGGKGANISKLIRAGFPIPAGFIITTAAYRQFIAENNLMGKISHRVSGMPWRDSNALEQASKEIRSWFKTSTTPPQIIDRVVDAYHALGDIPLAIRSSATAEDLPELSFAGQQDTFLNIISERTLLESMVDCWSSLWTARAIGYRARNGIAHEEVSIAVIVQEMVPAEVSGIMFTAHPLTGTRRELVIDAAFGLGEALVSGQVDPDHYVVDRKKAEVLSKQIGAKQLAILGKQEGGVQVTESEPAQRQALTDEQILQLARIGEQIEAFYDFPQDIEWAWAKGEFSILQSRPITSLFPVPKNMDTAPPHLMVSFGAVQGILDPITPLGQDAIRMIFAGGASLFDNPLTHETISIVQIAGERLWLDITAGLQHPLGSKAIPRFFSMIDPTAFPVFKTLKSDPQFKLGKGKMRLSTLSKLVSFALPLMKRVLHLIRSPEGKAEQIQHDSQQKIVEFSEIWKPQPGTTSSLPHWLQAFHELYYAFPYVIPNIFTGAIAGLIPFFLLNKMAFQLTGSTDLALTIARSLPNNVTLEMDLLLWETASAIHSDAHAFEHFKNSTSQQLTAEYSAGDLPETAQEAIIGFFTQYGMRGIGEIDIGRPRWREDPTHIMHTLLSYLQIEDDSLAPDVLFKRGEQAAEIAIEELQAAARKTFSGRIKARTILAAARRVRHLAGLRESPKFHIIQVMGIIRQGLLACGRDLVSQGTLDRPDDLFFLYLSELHAHANGNQNDWKTLIADRRRRYAREQLRVQIPHLLMSDGRAFYEGITPAEGSRSDMQGSPVSPGIAEGLVRVVLNPHDARLAPGEILVCPATDPAWTPLFLLASGLIMETGGMMTHGAIVAREYGIPAVVGVNQATTQLSTGQRIQINGSTGEIILVDR